MMEWLYSPWFWLVIGALLVIVEIMLGVVYFLLPVAGGAFLTAGAVWLDETLLVNDQLFYDGSAKVLGTFAVLCIACAIALKRLWPLLKQDAPPDPNVY